MELVPNKSRDAGFAAIVAAQKAEKEARLASVIEYGSIATPAAEARRARRNARRLSTWTGSRT
jgi:hypothetical protein